MPAEAVFDKAAIEAPVILNSHLKRPLKQGGRK